jgi:GTP:adenosylcobinamide-phosphate guanylyltransferase
MDAIITAGGRPVPEEPLYPVTQGAYKAMLDLLGKPMIQWVLDAVCAAKQVDRIIVIGLGPDCNLTCTKPLTYIPDQGGLIENIKAGVAKVQELNPQTEYVITVSSDIPAITPEMVDWVIQAAMQTRHEAYYNVIKREVMEARYPLSKRSYVKLKGLEVCGGDMNVLAVRMVAHQDEVWQKIVDSRKNALKQASLVGWDLLFLLLIRQVTLERAVDKITRRLGITGRAVLCPYAEVGMDVDKPHQLEMMRADLQQRSPQGVTP